MNNIDADVFAILFWGRLLLVTYAVLAVMSLCCDLIFKVKSKLKPQYENEEQLQKEEKE